MDWQGTIRELWEEDWVRYLLLPGLAALALALAGWRGERRRKRRSDPDAVSWVPWMGLTFWSSFAAMLLLGMALKAWVTG